MNSTEVLLTCSLSIAVPIEIERMREMGETYRLATARKAARYIAAHGDNVLFRSDDKRHTSAKAFAVLARALAAAAFQPGGVTIFGQHWCTDHAECLEAKRAAEKELCLTCGPR